MMFKVGDKVKININKLDQGVLSIPAVCRYICANKDSVYTIKEVAGHGWIVLNHEDLRGAGFSAEELILVESCEDHEDKIAETNYKVRFERFSDVVRAQVLQVPADAARHHTRCKNFNGSYMVECRYSKDYKVNIENGGLTLVIGHENGGKTSFCYKTPQDAKKAVLNFVQLIKKLNETNGGDIVDIGEVEETETIIAE